MYGERPSTENLVDERDYSSSPPASAITFHGQPLPSHYAGTPMVPMRSPNDYDSVDAAQRGGAMASEHIYQKMAVTNATAYPNDDIVEVEALDSDAESAVPSAYGETTLTNSNPQSYGETTLATPAAAVTPNQYDMVMVPLE